MKNKKRTEYNLACHQTTQFVGQLTLVIYILLALAFAVASFI